MKGWNWDDDEAIVVAVAGLLFLAAVVAVGMYSILHGVPW